MTSDSLNNRKLNLDVCLSPLLIDNFDLKNTIVVVIDIIRASTTICTVLEYGVSELKPIADVNSAIALKKEGYIIAGERNGIKLEGFDYDNSPISLMDRSLAGKKFAITTTNGTKTIAKISEKLIKFPESELIVGAYVNYSILKKYLISQNKNILLVCSGWKNNISIEDTVFAGQLVSDLLKFKNYEHPTDSANHAKLIYQNSDKNLFNFIMDYSMRFKDKIDYLANDIRYCLKFDVVNVIPVLKNGSFIKQ
ncbi:MAG: 2-phosphosulfolactate phosphatase [Bacteroidales bacterium]|nr:2-phosphosulfolactate phosphatase [Bacteroidales bacterium]MBN2756247.1 2-phosphosulfolactate phosphatase [Bacteroidales bacterium]